MQGFYKKKDNQHDVHYCFALPNISTFSMHNTFYNLCIKIFINLEKLSKTVIMLV